MNYLSDAIKSSWLCIKYPFLYPRNRWNDKHYNNWKLNEILNGKSENSYYDHRGGKLIKNPGKKGLSQKAFRYEFNPDNCEANRITISYWYALLYYLFKAVIWFNDLFHSIPTYTEWDEIPEGWAKAFGKQYLEELGNAVKTLPRKDRRKFRIEEIKEKYGTLRVYVNFGNDNIYDVINKYEELSLKTCIKCGKPATKLSGGWICPYCDDCIGDRFVYAELENNMWKYFDEYEE